MGTEHAPKPGDPHFKLVPSEPPSKSRGELGPDVAKAIELLAQLRDQHPPGTWACIVTYPKWESSRPDDVKPKGTKANALKQAIQRNWPEAAQFELAARTLPDGRTGIWAQFLQKAIEPPRDA